MRPERQDIAAPEPRPDLRWLNGRPPSMARLCAAGPVLVHFFDFAQLNSVRTLPYVCEWDRRYAEAGLTVLGVQEPRFAFGHDPGAVAAGLGRLGISFPVAIDSGRDLWLDYGCSVWPSLFLWGRGGILRWFHFGEGEYRATEEAIQAELPKDDRRPALPEPMAPLRPADAPGARVRPPSPEVFPGSEDRPWIAAESGNELSIDYEAGGAYVTAEGEGGIDVSLDGNPGESVNVRGAGLYPAAEHPGHERHRLVLRPSEGVSVWSVSFAAGTPG